MRACAPDAPRYAAWKQAHSTLHLPVQLRQGGPLNDQGVIRRNDSRLGSLCASASVSLAHLGGGLLRCLAQPNVPHAALQSQEITVHHAE
ncbi:hypothetical protein SKAU_G00255410 [Synaphobranchus kaupii]|uniref:Uncharacterized protein n=1 Tax=Synaphobranchus kaupii TaxID=118154 RepID=A0A9Q1F3W1_SYNKA|nr:hypothetical protein SKAU_G00255410 [Synaphobranchus kaupii]